MAPLHDQLPALSLMRDAGGADTNPKVVEGEHPVANVAERFAEPDALGTLATVAERQRRLALACDLEQVSGDLYFVHEMATDDEMDRLLEAAKATGISIDDTPESTPADIAVQVWLKSPALIERMHAEVMVQRPKSFEYFAGKAGARKDIPAPTPKQIEAIQANLDAWFVEHKRGVGSRVFVFSDKDNKSKAWILVRHGKTMTREGATKDGESSSVYYRPEVHDVLIYDATQDEIGIHTGTKGEQKLYREVFGSHLFGDPAYFPEGDKFTLQPLIDDGADSMVCSDVDGIEWVKLKEVQRYWGGKHKEIETRRADDLFAAMVARSTSFSAGAKLIRAVFLVKFDDAKTPRTVAIRPKNIARYTRDEDSVRIEKWLMKRGFVLAPEPEGDEDEPTEAALADA